MLDFCSDSRQNPKNYLQSGKSTIMTFNLLIRGELWILQISWYLYFVLLGVGIDGGNGKDWESNAKSIQLIKQRGKVKALDEEINSKLRLICSFDENQSLTNGALISHVVCILWYSWDT